MPARPSKRCPGLRAAALNRGYTPRLQRKRHVAHDRSREPHAADVARAIRLAVDEQLTVGGESDQLVAEQPEDAIVETHYIDRRHDPPTLHPERREAGHAGQSARRPIG